MIDPSSEHLLTFAEAAKALPHPVHISCLHRWRQRGVRGVRLETCMIGGRRYTSREALERFSAATTAAAEGKAQPARTPRQRQQAIEQAEREMGMPSSTTATNNQGVKAVT